MGKDKDKKKSKKEDSDSSSDSGPDDVKAPPQKKAKSSKNDDGEQSWHIEKNRYVKVREFKGSVYVDIREYYEADGELKPGKKGISLTASQWRKFKGLISEVDEALEQK